MLLGLPYSQDDFLPEQYSSLLYIHLCTVRTQFIIIIIIESCFKSCRVFPQRETSDPDRRQV
jgi:hypothetical protein